MEKLAPFVESLLGVGIGATCAILVAMYVVRGAVAKAVELAGQKELERLKTELSKDIEDKRNAFARELEVERQAAARNLEAFKAELTKHIEDKRSTFARELEVERQTAARNLEAFKAELSLPAEVRRQVAARKVAAAAEIMQLGEPLARQLRAAPKAQDAEAFAPTMALLNNYSVKVRELAHYFDEDVAEGLYAYSGELLAAKVKWDAKPAVELFENAGNAYLKLLSTIRFELGLGRPRSARE